MAECQHSCACDFGGECDDAHERRRSIAPRDGWHPSPADYFDDEWEGRKLTYEGSENALRNLVASLRPDVVSFREVTGCWMYMTREQCACGEWDLIEVIW